ncbi:Uncharacterised protein [Vibrio cholerae]|nr:Uncharacterised protein [Vibrio cholerae]
MNKHIKMARQGISGSTNRHVRDFHVNIAPF